MVTSFSSIDMLDLLFERVSTNLFPYHLPKNPFTNFFRLVNIHFICSFNAVYNVSQDGVLLKRRFVLKEAEQLICISMTSLLT